MKSYQNCIKFHILNCTKNNQVEKCTVYSKCTCSAYRLNQKAPIQNGIKNMKPYPSRKKPGHCFISLPRENEPRLHLLVWKNNSGSSFPQLVPEKILYPVREGKLKPMIVQVIIKRQCTCIPFMLITCRFKYWQDITTSGSAQQQKMITTSLKQA